MFGNNKIKKLEAIITTLEHKISYLLNKASEEEINDYMVYIIKHDYLCKYDRHLLSPTIERNYRCEGLLITYHWTNGWSMVFNGDDVKISQGSIEKLAVNIKRFVELRSEKKDIDDKLIQLKKGKV